MPRPSTEALELAGRFRLGLAARVKSGPHGERTGRGTGSSLEFQDRRSYAPGDDVRHLDWRAYARTDQLLVRVYREEVLPRVELLIDASRSMRVDAAKAQRTVDLAVIVARAGRAEGLLVTARTLGDRCEPLELERLEREGFELEGRTPLADALASAPAPLRPGALRVVLSDFLVPGDPRALVREVARGAGVLLLGQVLARGDLEPVAGEALRLTDAERGGSLELVVDRAAVARYRRRLDALCADLDEEARRLGGDCVRIRSDEPLERTCVGPLVDAGLLVPA